MVSCRNLVNAAIIACLVLNGPAVQCLKFGDEASASSGQTVANISGAPQAIEGRQSARHLFDYVGLGTGNNIDPYLRKTNEKCLNGELAECFKSQALNTFDDFFKRDVYVLTPHVRVLRVPETQLRSLDYEPYEFSNEARQISESTEWSELIQFALRKAERFMKSNVIELEIPEQLTEGGRYSPRFVDEISDELDVIEDKHAPLFTKHKIKKMFIPMLIILKLFKLKLLLFLPFILGITGLKKILGLAALVVPGVIGYFKLCRPTSGFNNHIYSEGQSYPQYSAQGLGGASYSSLYSKYPSNPYREDPGFASPYNNYYSRDASVGIDSSSSGSVRFGEDAQDLAYRNSKISS
jgi:hypothetical protein